MTEATKPVNFCFVTSVSHASNEKPVTQVIIPARNAVYKINIQ